MTKKKKETGPQGILINNPGGSGEGKIKGQVPRMKNPPPPPKKKYIKK